MPKTSVAALEVPSTSSILQWYHILNEATYYYLACEAWDVQIDAKDVEEKPGNFSSDGAQNLYDPRGCRRAGSELGRVFVKPQTA